MKDRYNLPAGLGRLALRCVLLGAPVCIGLCLPAPARADKPAAADDLLRRADKKATSFSDATFHFKMRILESDGAREIEFVTLQKGNQKRLVRFLSPGDIKGMGILVESADTMYALLPAFGNRVRRVGTSQANQSFMGSDLATEDMSALELSQAYTAQFSKTPPEGDQTVLDLSARPGAKTEFPRLKVWIDSKNEVLTRLEYYDAAGKKLRTQVRSDFHTDEGNAYATPHKLSFTDHRRNDHQTELILLDSKFNTKLSDDEFSVRSLQRN